MAEESATFQTTTNHEDTEIMSAGESEDPSLRTRPPSRSDTKTSSPEDTDRTRKVLKVQRVSEHSTRTTTDINEEEEEEAENTRLETRRVKLKDASVEQHGDIEDKENTAGIPQDNADEEHTSGQETCQNASMTTSKQQPITEEEDAVVVKRAQEEGRVNVIFPGTVTQEGCCRFVSEILKCILYQRQQLPMTYDQLLYSQKKRQASMQNKDTVSRRPDSDWRKCQQTLQELEEVMQQLEVLFSLSRVPRVLLLMGGSLIHPKELYEVNMEDLLLAGGDQCLRVSSCLRQLFRTLFVADLLSDTKPVRLMSTTVLVLAHRDCGIAWFRPKLQFKVPTRVKNKIIALSSDPSISKGTQAEESDWQDYVWFQAPMNIKGFSN